jgi:quercetin dioxygenase-like cupin family protein
MNVNENKIQIGDINNKDVNTNYLTVQHTVDDLQMVFMNMKTNNIINKEKHDNATQFVYVINGEITIYVYENENDKNGKNHGSIKKNQYIIIPKGTWHAIKALNDDTKLYTIYTSPTHLKTMGDKNNNNDNRPCSEETYKSTSKCNIPTEKQIGGSIQSIYAINKNNYKQII